MPDTTVKFFDKAQSGAPALAKSAGSLIALLDACLINGYGSITLDSLTITDGIATAIKSTGHGFTMTGAAGPVIAISGVSTPTALNGEWRIATIPTSTTLTFAVPGISNQTATGTIAVKRAPAGWEKVFSGTNKAVYRALSGTRFYLRVDDTAAASARIVAYESMSDVDTGTNPFPTAAQESGGHLFKKALANTWWRLVADQKTLYLLANYQDDGWTDEFPSQCIGFGDIASFKTADVYAATLIGTKADGSVCGLAYVGAPSDGRRVTARAHDGATLSVVNGSYLPKSNTTADRIGMTAQTAYPNPASAGLVVAPMPVWDSGPVWRGHFRGLYSPMHALITHGTTEATADGQVLYLARFYTAIYEHAQAVFDLTGPWS